MPLYAFECGKCGFSTELFRHVAGRNQPAKCQRGCGRMARVPENFKAKTFEPYYDEGLGSDVHSEKHRRQLMADLGLVEAGDPVHGGRNFDASAPELIEKQPLKGRVKKMHKKRDEQIVQVIDKDGSVIQEEAWDDLPGYDDE